MSARWTKMAACLQRIGENIRKYKTISLHNRNEVVIGRAPNADVTLTATVISRQHAVMKKKPNNEWTIVDMKSMNGIFVNNMRLKPDERYELKNGDIIQLGIPPIPDSPAEFIFKYCCLSHDESNECLNLKRKRSEDLQREEELHKKMKLEQEKLKEEAERLRMESAQKLNEMQILLEQKEAEKANTIELMKEKEEKENLAKEAIQEAEKKLNDLTKLLAEKEAEKETTLHIMKQKEETMKDELMEQQKKLEDERKAFTETLEKQLKEKEELLMQKLQAERESLLAVKKQVEDKLKQEMEQKLEEKDKSLQNELEKEREKLSKIIRNKELEQKMLESQLQATKQENEKQQETMLLIKKNVLSDFTELMETELQCSICNELFIQATTLNCSHSFCALCISQWMSRKKQCPICRGRITSHQRAIVLDSYIDKMVEHLDEDMKKTRAAIIESRKGIAK
ncbi:E3 ubiquitin-protein ligase RNF8-like isoform X2 [Tubulanus polymorphus]|uniref:E3 ubiquitin-protein ligase RNF8-like isoform X2 n=1 Tax=Tubulanus polymorphus TaxID=672921 RepID=UPI003DA3BE93